MIRATIETRESGLTRRVSVVTPCIERALRIAGHGKPCRRVRLVSYDHGRIGGRDAELGEVA